MVSIENIVLIINTYITDIVRYLFALLNIGHNHNIAGFTKEMSIDVVDKNIKAINKTKR